MTLEAKDKLINDLIKENPDATIRDYLEVCKEIIGIENASGTAGAQAMIMNAFMNTRRQLKAHIRK